MKAHGEKVALRPGRGKQEEPAAAAATVTASSRWPSPLHAQIARLQGSGRYPRCYRRLTGYATTSWFWHGAAQTGNQAGLDFSGLVGNEHGVV